MKRGACWINAGVCREYKPSRMPGLAASTPKADGVPTASSMSCSSGSVIAKALLPKGMGGGG